MTGDQSDMYARLRALLPAGWFGDDNPILDAVLYGCANSLSWAYTLYAYAVRQTRIKTATDGFLDLIAADFFGQDGLPRAANQGDASYLNKIVVNMFRERGTRKSVSSVLYDLTGRYPLIFEPERPADTGGYGAGAGYRLGGGYGSLLMPYQAFVTAYRPVGTGIPSIAGYGISTSGYSVANQGEYASLDMVQGGVTDTDIYDAISSVKMEGTIAWTRILSNPEPTPTRIGVDYTVGESIVY
ncbi:hypothetical protein [Martelella alba]|nr:hypothetical protein [Martelella alba]